METSRKVARIKLLTKDIANDDKDQEQRQIETVLNIKVLISHDLKMPKNQ